MFRSLTIVFILAACGSKAAPSSPRSADYGAQVARDIEAYADRQCQCADKVDEACSKKNVAERDAYYQRIDRSRPFSAEENLSIDLSEKRFESCAKRFAPVLLE